MICKKCQAKLDVEQSYVVPMGHTQRAVCVTCDVVYTAVTITHLEEASHGTGAYATAQKIKRGELSPVVRFEGGAR